MIKRISVLALCLVLLVGSLSGCSGKLEGDDKGAYISMYITDDIYDFDPAKAYTNLDATNVLGMLFETVFKLDSDGKVVNGLAKSYKTFTDDDGFHMEIKLREAYWSNQFALTANDVVFAWRRLLKPENKFAAASLLFDIKNARAYNSGVMTEDDLMVEAVEQQVIRITFEDQIDVQAFLVNLTSVATAPLLKSALKGNDDWAKKASTLVTSGAFKVAKIKYATEAGVYFKDDNALDVNGVRNSDGLVSYAVNKIEYFILERNSYYQRDPEEDALNKSVQPYRILVDCTMDDATLLSEYQAGHIFYIGNIPLSLRSDAYVAENVKVSDSISTFSILLNEDATINGVKLFDDVHVRKALSLVLDREAIANSVVYAKAATALIPSGVFESSGKKDFRSVGGDLLATSANLSAAQAELAQVGFANFNPSDYSFTLRVAAYDEVHVFMANQIATAWNSLGFNVTVEEVETIENNDERSEAGEISIAKDVCDDLFEEAVERGNYEAIAYDYTAYAPTAWAMISSFATSFTGVSEMQEDSSFLQIAHPCGYCNETYNNLMEAIYFMPFYSDMEPDPDASIFDDLETCPYAGFGIESKEEYTDLYTRISYVYATHDMTPSDQPKVAEKQRALLLHEAEELLLNDLPIIPVVFNQNAILVSKQLSKVSSDYYTPANFQKTKLKNYKDYQLVFKSFPAVDWTKFGMVEEETA